MSRTFDHAVEAYNRGYYVDDEGVVQGPRGVRVVSAGHNDFMRFSLADKARPGKHINVAVHKLAAYQLYGDEVANPKWRIKHKDYDRHNNRPDNIELATHSDIMLGTPQTQRWLYGVNAAKKRRRLSDAQLVEFRAMRAAGATLSKLVKHFGIAKSTASYIMNGKTYA